MKKEDVHMKDQTMRAWAEISLDALAHNYQALRSRLRPDCKFLATAKADCYGHGAEVVAPFLQELGADAFSTATVQEAVQLRERGVTVPILVLGYTAPELAGLLWEHGITQAVFSADYARALAEKLGEKRMKVHIKLDTGMGRLGFDPERDLDRVAEIAALPCFEAEGIFTHFARADEAEGIADTITQFERFESAVEGLRQRGITFAVRHCANSAAALNYPETQLDMVRMGVALYGAYPDGSETGDWDLRSVMSLKSRLVQVKQFPTERAVSYGGTATVPAGSRVAVMAMGYADGLHRCASNRYTVKLRGREVPGVGRICMDMSMLDVTSVPEAAPGDVVTIFGGAGENAHSVEKLAKSAGTISYELFCGVGKRVPRVYIKNSSIWAPGP